MSNSRYSLLRKVFTQLPVGALVDSAWFQRNNISNQSVYGYVRKGLLVRLSRGVFLLSGTEYDPKEKLDWEVILASLARVMEVKFHVGGLTAIELLGRQHFGTFGPMRRVEIYGENLPKWLAKVNANGKFISSSNNLFKTASLGIQQYQGHDLAIGDEVSYPISGLERSILEMVDSIRGEASFEHVDLLFQSMYDANPELLIKLLKDCRKIKVRRLFLLLAERHNHSWMSSIDKSMFELGTHSRQFIKHGRYHSEYKITVPEYVLPREDEICYF